MNTTEQIERMSHKATVEYAIAKGWVKPKPTEPKPIPGAHRGSRYSDREAYAVHLKAYRRDWMRRHRARLKALGIRPGERWVRLPAMDTLRRNQNAS